MRDRRCWLGHKWDKNWKLSSTKTYEDANGVAYKGTRTWSTSCMTCGRPKVMRVPL